MAEIKAFKGLRFTEKAGKIDTLICPPYDIISEEERIEFLKTNENNIIRLELPSGEDKYKEAGKTLKSMLNNGILKQDEKESIYIYEEEFTAFGERKKVKGFICLVKLEEFEKNIILPHEETLSKAKADRFNLMSETFCNFSQVYSLYMDDGKKTFSKIDRLSNRKPDIECKDNDNVIHRLWIVSDENEINDIINDFKDRKLFIADGHHRYETALNFRNKLREEGKINDSSDLGNYLMMDLVDMENEGLVVLPTHRLVKDLKNFDEQDIVNKLNKNFFVEKRFDLDNIEKELMLNAHKKCFGFYTGKVYYYKLTLKNMNAVNDINTDKCSAYNNLDVTVLHTLILEEIMGIDKENMAKQINLTYTKKIEEAISKVAEGSFQAAFILNATKVSEIRDVASAGEKMPQKSTYFYPKLITGLVMNKLL